MSVDFSQFFNGPIRDSLIAQVSGYLDIPRPQATTAYDKAVALVIGAMARHAGKPEGAQELAAHIRDSQTQASLTSSALSPTVLTNDQFAQIVTVGEREQATILGPQLDPVASHLEVATGLDRTAVGSLLSIIVPFVLSYLKNNITTETSAADKLPALLAAQAPHVSSQLDAPALAALGGESLEDLFGPDVNGSTDSHAAPAAAHDRSTSSLPANANERTKSGWFKWVLVLAVILAGVAWIKSCTQSETPLTDTTEPAAQDQSPTAAPASETAPATEAAPAGAPSPATEPAPASDAGATDSSGGADAPAAHFPEPIPAPSSEASPAPVEKSTPPTATDTASSAPAAQASSASEESGADSSANKGAANTGEAATAAAAAADTPASASEAGSDQTGSDQTGSDKNAADSAPETPQPARAEDSTPAEPTSGPASDSMEAEPAPTDESDAGADATTPASQGDQSAPAADAAASGKTTTFADATTTAATGAASNAADSNAADSNAADSNAADSNAADSSAADSTAAAPIETSGKTTTFAAPTDSQASAAQESAAPQDPSETADKSEPHATHSDTSANASSTEVGVPGKTTTFGDAAPSAEPTEASGPGTGTMSSNTDAKSSDTPATVSDTATNDQSATQLRLQREDDALKISGTVPNESIHTRIMNAVKLVDGHSQIEDDIKIDPQATAIPFEDYSGLLSLLRGYPKVNMNLESNALTLTGQVVSQAEKDTLSTRVRNLVGSSIQVHNQVDVVPAQAEGSAAAAAQVLFASGSAEVDDRFHDTLDRLAQQLQDNDKRVKLVGFADESGTTPLNEALSKRRAESVKAYLILRGVPADRIHAEGQGVQAPVANNATQEGRAQNRRVEFHQE